MHIRFDKIDGFIRVYNGAIYLVLFGPEKYDSIYIKLRYILTLKSSTTDVFFQNYAKMKNDFFDFLPIEKKTLTLHNVIILIKSVFNKD